MNLWTHGAIAYSLTYVGASLILPDPIAHVLAGIAGALGAWPDVDGEREKWSFPHIGNRELARDGKRYSDGWVFIAIRDKNIWEQYGRWHAGDLRKWAREYWVWPILAHVDMTDPLIHRPTWLIDKEKHPTLYSIVWWALDTTLLTLAVLALFNIIWWWALLGAVLAGWGISAYRTRRMATP